MCAEVGERCFDCSVVGNDGIIVTEPDDKLKTSGNNSVNRAVDDLDGVAEIEGVNDLGMSDIKEGLGLHGGEGSNNAVREGIVTHISDKSAENHAKLGAVFLIEGVSTDVGGR